MTGDKKTKLFIVGDSISIHYGKYLKPFLGDDFVYERKTGKEKVLPDDPEIRKENGGDSSCVLRYLHAMTKILKTDYLLVNCGLHDIKRDSKTGNIQVSLAAYKANLEKIVALSKQICPNFVWITTTPFSERIHNSKLDNVRRFESDNIRYRTTAASVMSGHKLPIIDLHKFTKRFKSRKHVYVDHVHFNESIRMLQASYVAGWITAFHQTSQ